MNDFILASRPAGSIFVARDELPEADFHDEVTYDGRRWRVAGLGLLAKCWVLELLEDSDE